MAIMHDQRGVDNYRSVCTYEYTRVCKCVLATVAGVNKLHSKETTIVKSIKCQNCDRF